MGAKVKKDDFVFVMSGKDKGRSGKVLEVIPSAERVVVEGVNVVAKHVKPSIQDPNGGIKRFEAPIHVSKVMLRDPKTGEPTRVGFKVADNGYRVRYAKKSGVVIDTVDERKPARKAKTQEQRNG